MGDKAKVIYAFIDSQNLNLSVRKNIRDSAGAIIFSGWKLDFKRFYVYLKDKYKVNKAFWFIGYIEENEKFYSLLENAGFEIIFKEFF